LGFLAEVEARINEIESQNPGITVVLTGGDAPVLAERLKNRIFVEPLLIHKGLFHCLLLNEN
jgi:pantothenate kinase type III